MYIWFVFGGSSSLLFFTDQHPTLWRDMPLLLFLSSLTGSRSFLLFLQTPRVTAPFIYCLARFSHFPLHSRPNSFPTIHSQSISNSLLTFLPISLTALPVSCPDSVPTSLSTSNSDFPSPLHSHFRSQFPSYFPQTSPPSHPPFLSASHPNSVQLLPRSLLASIPLLFLLSFPLHFPCIRLIF